MVGLNQNTVHMQRNQFATEVFLTVMKEVTVLYKLSLLYVPRKKSRTVANYCPPGELSREPHRNMKLVMTYVEEVCITAKETTVGEHPTVVDSLGAYEVFRMFFAQHMNVQEAMRVMLLHQNCQVKGVLTIGKGGLAGMTADHRLIFAAALKTLSCTIVLAHNHPSGDVTPSPCDIAWTKRAQQIGEFHDIRVRDHLILGRNGYYSFADNGLL